MLLSHTDTDTKKDSNTTAGQTKPYYFYELGLLMGYFIHPFKILEQQNNSSKNDEEVYTPATALIL